MKKSIEKIKARWWLNQRNWNIFYTSQIESSPKVGVKIFVETNT